MIYDRYVFPEIDSPFSITKNIASISIFLHFMVVTLFPFYVSGHCFSLVVCPGFTTLLFLLMYFYLKVHGFWEKMALSSAKE